MEEWLGLRPETLDLGLGLALDLDLGLDLGLVLDLGLGPGLDLGLVLDLDLELVAGLLSELAPPTPGLHPVGWRLAVVVVALPQQQGLSPTPEEMLTSGKCLGSPFRTGSLAWVLLLGPVSPATIRLLESSGVGWKTSLALRWWNSLSWSRKHDHRREGWVRWSAS